MGYQLVQLAFARRPYLGLSQRSFLVLVRMCDVAHDRPTKTAPAAIYFGGWDLLAAAIGFELPDWDGAVRNDTAHRAVTRAMRELTDAGLIKRVEGQLQKTHRRRAYAITLGDHHVPSEGTTTSPNR